MKITEHIKGIENTTVKLDGSAPMTGELTVPSILLDTMESATGDTIVVNSSIHVKADVIVDGELTTITATEIAVDDKNITMANTDDPNDVTADGGGITIKGDTDKTLLWDRTTDSWQISSALDVEHAITVGSTVDGRDIAADGVTLDKLVTDVNMDYSKYLGALGITNMEYDAQETLIKITYEGVDNWQELTYDADGLTNIEHVVAGVTVGNTDLNYTNGSLTSALYTDI